MPSLEQIVHRCQQVMAHAWMVRTFVKHSDEAEDFPELMGVVRAVFDTSRALETRVDDPPAYVQMLRKKIGKLRAAAAEFRRDAAEASTHTNFQQAVVSLDACVAELERLLDSAPQPAARPPLNVAGGFDEPSRLDGASGFH
ncbi:MAG TPA: amidohydrolase [Planctomycetaceae bacterium]|nr:amidohydrolase [Planctomycetaceae bacterium]